MVDRSVAAALQPGQDRPGDDEADRVAAAAQALGRGPVAAEIGVAPSTAGAVLRRCGISRLARLERRERQIIRYEHAGPGELLHVDVKKLGNIPAGGGWRILGRDAGQAQPGRRRRPGRAAGTTTR